MASAAARVLGRYYSLLLLMAAWEAVSRLGLAPARLVPGVEDIALQLWRFAASGDLVYHASVTLERAFLGFLAAIVCGGALGTVMALSPRADRLVGPIFSFGYPIPRISLFPIFTFVFGFGDMSKIVLIFLECLFPITLQTLHGMRSAERVLVWAARNMGADGRTLFWRVYMPSAAPAFFAGIRIALPVSLIIAIITEIIGDSRGLGFVVAFQSASFEYARALAAFLVIGAFGFALDRLLVLARSRIIYWQKDAPPLI
jgi:NitT/TauT family transport system permease protein